MSAVISPTELSKIYATKRLILIIVFGLLPMFFATVVFPPDHIRLLWLSPGKAEVLKLSEEHKAAIAERDNLRKQLDAMSALNETLRKKAQTVTLGEKSFTPPAILPRYMSWADFQKENPGADFKTYRERQVEFLHGEIDKATAFFNTLND